MNELLLIGGALALLCCWNKKNSINGVGEVW